MANSSVVFSEFEKRVTFLVNIDTINTYISVDSRNPTGVPGQACILESMTYYIASAHTLTFSNGEASPKEFAMPFEAGAGVDSSREIFIPSAMGKPLQVKSTVAGKFLCTVSYRG